MMISAVDLIYWLLIVLAFYAGRYEERTRRARIKREYDFHMSRQIEHDPAAAFRRAGL